MSGPISHNPFPSPIEFLLSRLLFSFSFQNFALDKIIALLVSAIRLWDYTTVFITAPFSSVVHCKHASIP